MTMLDIFVTKRDGTKEKLDFDKIHRVVECAAEGLEGVSVSSVELRARIQFYDGISTDTIHKTLIKAAVGLITAQTPNYQYLAARLCVFGMRKASFGSPVPPRLYDHVMNMVEKGVYDKDLTFYFSEEDFDELDAHLDHTLDMGYSYAGISQLEDKYLAQHRVTGEIYESIQILNMMVSATAFIHADEDVRMGLIKEFYDALARDKFISLPTPIMGGLRTSEKQFSSCVLIESDDSLDSITATAGAIVRYVSNRAGIGIGGGNIRAIGSPIKGGKAFHTGCIPFFKHFLTAVKSCSQGGIRGGAATLFYPMWHLEVEDFLVLKNNKGTEETRIRHLDYGVQINGLLYERLIADGVITLFSPSDVPGLYEAFFSDQDKFKELYEKYEKDDSIRKKRVRAMTLFVQSLVERSSTSRIYVQNVDHCNTHSSFLEDVAPVRMSNLCVEITLPTKPLQSLEDPNGEIALCTLGAINVGLVKDGDFDALEKPISLLVHALDNILSYQEYPVLAAKRSTLSRRPLGIGVVNYAYFLANHGVKFSDGSAEGLTHRLFEAIQYWSLRASVELAKEKGPCDLFHETKYSKGILPIDTYKRTVDDYCNEPLMYDWEELRKDILTYGLRNSTLTALMPSETSSQISNATNGIEPPRRPVTSKLSKSGKFLQVVPESERLKDAYEYYWDIPGNTGYLRLVGIMQKFIDQSISTNTKYSPSEYPDNKVPMQLMLKDLLTAYKFGVKTLYYHNTDDVDDLEDEACPSCVI